MIRLMKERCQQCSSLEIEVTAHPREEYPKYFHTFEVKYIVKGKNIDEKKLKKAIEMSEDKYCSVSQTMINKAEIKSTYEIIEE